MTPSLFKIKILHVLGIQYLYIYIYIYLDLLYTDELNARFYNLMFD